MVIDFTQNRDSVDISYVTENGKIEVENVLLEPGSPNGFFRIVETTEEDPSKIPGLVSFYGNPLRKEPANRFNGLNFNEFLCHSIKDLNPTLYEKMRMLREPKPYSVDIEVLPTDEFGYSDATAAENPITSIQITNYDLTTVVFCTKNSKYALGSELKEDDRMYIEAILKEAMGKYYYYGGDRCKDPIKFTIKEFETETEMLVSYIAAVNKYFHMTLGWNYYGYDVPYIFNRCKRKGLDVKKMSPKNCMAPVKNSVNISLEVPIEYPQHRMAIDYMNIFKGSELYRTLDNFSLDRCSEEVLNIHKVSYEGNLRKLYNDDYLRFIAYSLLDPILVQLLNKETNLLSTYFFQSYYTELPYMKLNQNPISLSLIYKHLRDKGKFICESEYPEKISRQYIGAFVKQPTVHYVDSCMGEDFGSLYPNSMISCYLSFDNKVPDTIMMDDSGHPINEFNQKKFDKYRAENCCITPMGRIYKRDDNNIYTSIEKGLLKQRKEFKKPKEDLYLNIIPMIQQEIASRKNKH